MLDALQIAATGMQAQQLHVDTIANNLANTSTPAFKRARVVFHDLVSRGLPPPSGAAGTAAGDDVAPAAGQVQGVGVTSVLRQFEQGELRRTDNPLDLAIQGEGFLEVLLADGSRAYSRGGSLKVNADGLLALASGPVLSRQITLPEGASGLAIEADGRVQARPQGAAKALEYGQIELVRFASPTALVALGDGLYRASAESGEPIGGRMADEPASLLRQGHLEASNVKLVDEMVGLMVAQRAYEASVKVAQAADEMLAMVNGLRK